ncbi:hypothetical protein DM02DRAFT_651935 [Periconia macrospinosa]|uniref:Uncharacterized protein n=1 Tax=Periconia macrospinosa TaxID=97972 RepID=A0A2V1E0T5_9PLEO|nr:hypothetical protein DM02DRAFT_651935 [Periconia macrospinosa]
MASYNQNPFKRNAQSISQARNLNPQNSSESPFQQPQIQYSQPMPHTNRGSNPKSTNEVYTGMAFCPGIDKIPVARFLPPEQGICNFMADEYKGQGPVVATNCPRCAQPKRFHKGGPKAEWHECQNNCFCHNAPPRIDTLFCPGLYSSVNKIVRTFKWPGNVELPGYLRIFPTEEQHKHLINAGYIEGPYTQSKEIPMFTQKAWALERELDALAQWALGQVGYDLEIMLNRDKPENLPRTHGVKRSHGTVFDNAGTPSQVPSYLKHRPTNRPLQTMGMDRPGSSPIKIPSILSPAGPSSQMGSVIMPNAQLRSRDVTGGRSARDTLFQQEEIIQQNDSVAMGPTNKSLEARITSLEARNIELEQWIYNRIGDRVGLPLPTTMPPLRPLNISTNRQPSPDSPNILIKREPCPD